jgi:hypothetical protein
MRKKWYYQGDMNIEHGGSFYCLEGLKDGYAEAIRVYPCSDAGAQDNCWWVDVHTINMPSKQEVLEKALQYCGIPPILSMPLTQVMALHEYGEYYTESSVVVQIGPDDPYYNGHDPVEPDIRLRAGTDLEKWVRRRYHLGSKK